MKASLSHYHITCPDKEMLAAWYCDELGFVLINDLEKEGEKDGPLFISADGGKSGIAIFSKSERPTGFALACIPAFEISPEDFLKYFQSKEKSSPLKVYDHLVSFSLYVVDPVGTKLELVSHQYSALQLLLKGAGITPTRMNPSHDPDFDSKSPHS